MTRRTLPPDTSPVMWELWRLAKVAERTGLGKTKLYDLMHKGEFPAARRVGGSVAWLSGDVIEWMAALPTSDNKAGVGADDAQESAA